MYKINSNIKPLKELPVSGIYQIRNLVNNKIYVGSTENFGIRKKRHFYQLKKGNHTNIHLQNAYNKYGKESFIFEIIEYVKNKNDIIRYEQHFLNYFSMINSDGLYNICFIAGNTTGRESSQETREKLSKIHLGKKKSKETRDMMSLAQIGNQKNLGKKHSPETKIKMGAWQKGSNNLMAKLNEEQVSEIKKLLKENKKTSEICEIYNVTNGTIYAIKSGRNWKHVE
jgi:group I intron endonuclease